MADGMLGMPWKEALKRLKEYHQAGADGSPASMQKELEGLEESLKGWEARDERRGRALDALSGVERQKVAVQLLAGALANSSTTYPPIFLVDGQGYGDTLASERMVKNSVKLADMLLKELTK